MASRRDVTAELERLPWQQREALFAAVGSGRAVSDPELGGLAADHAEIAHRQVLRTCMWVMASSSLVAAGGLIWLASQGDGSEVGGAMVGVVMALTMLGALMWATTLRPLVRARRANLRLARLAAHAARERNASSSG